MTPRDELELAALLADLGLGDRPPLIPVSPLDIVRRLEVALCEVYVGNQSAEARALVDALEDVGLRLTRS